MFANPKGHQLVDAHVKAHIGSRSNLKEEEKSKIKFKFKEEKSIINYHFTQYYIHKYFIIINLGLP